MASRRRIYITGGAGSGKTTLARQLSDATGIPWYELDTVLWTEKGTGERIPDTDRSRLISGIASEPSWIADGVYVGWAQELWRTADLVIYLDTSLKRMLWRVFWRHVKAELRRNNRHPGWLTLFRFMRTIARMHRSPVTGDIDDGEDEILTTAKIAAKVEQHKNKTLVVDSIPDIDKILSVINPK